MTSPTKLHGYTRVGNTRAGRSRGTAYGRLVDAATHLAGHEGSAHLTVDRLIASAGVSRASFYQYFKSADDCIWTAFREAGDRLVAAVAEATTKAQIPELAAITVLGQTAASRPAEARLLMRESLAVGPTGLQLRRVLIGRIERRISSRGAAQTRIDIPAPLLIGATFRFLSITMAECQNARTLESELNEWASTFSRPRGSCLSDYLAHPLAVGTPSAIADGSPSSKPGGPRERILAATVALIEKSGYRELTVDSIARRADVSRRTFYHKFPSKEAAAIAAYEQGFRRLLAECAPAYFSATDWPEQVWQAARAFATVVDEECGTAHLGFAECYAIGTQFASRVHSTLLAFTLFLEDGYRRNVAAGQPLPRTYGTLTAATMAEIAFLASQDDGGRVMRAVPLAVYLVLTPFIGSVAAATFVSEKLRAMAAHGPRLRRSR